MLLLQVSSNLDGQRKDKPENMLFLLSLWVLNKLLFVATRWTPQVLIIKKLDIMKLRLRLVLILSKLVSNLKQYHLFPFLVGMVITC